MIETQKELKAVKSWIKYFENEQSIMMRLEQTPAYIRAVFGSHFKAMIEYCIKEIATYKYFNNGGIKDESKDSNTEGH